MTARTLAARAATASMLVGIEAYQRYVSPYKGYSCAYRMRHGALSCSELIKRAIAIRGPLAALDLARRRFLACQKAAADSGAESDGKTGEHRKNTDPSGGIERGSLVDCGCYGHPCLCPPSWW